MEQVAPGMGTTGTAKRARSAAAVNTLAAPSALEEGDRYRPLTAHVADVDALIREQELEQHVYELDVLGYTVVRDALAPGAVSRLTDALLKSASEGGPVDTVRGTSHQQRTQEVVLLLARGGRPLEELVLHPVTLPLITYLLGASCTVSSVTGYVKGPGGAPLGVHSDTAFVPDPLPPYAQLANVNYCLTEYTEAAGCLTVVPGSHRYCHRPRDGQGTAEAVPVEAPAGSAIVFHGNTWHGARPRTQLGTRLTISTLFCRMYMRPQERYDEILPGEVLERNPPRLRTLVGKDVPTGWRSMADADRIRRLREDYAPTYYRTRGGYA